MPVKDQFITVVSGLPRSGTSMMMRMLEGGGMPILMDGVREADTDNPRGYYEFEPVKRMESDTAWLSEAYGKALKVIYIFLYRLPKTHKYKVLFLRRNLDEVIASQKTMLRVRQQQGASLTDEEMAESFDVQLQKLYSWIRDQEHISAYYLDYHDVVADPERSAAGITSFLGLPLDVASMAKAVDPLLYRNRFEKAI